MLCNDTTDHDSSYYYYYGIFNFLFLFGPIGQANSQLCQWESQGDSTCLVAVQWFWHYIMNWLNFLLLLYSRGIV